MKRGNMFDVANQPPPLEPYNLFASDAVLREAVEREGAGWGEARLDALGATLGKPETIQRGFDANKYPPSLAASTVSATASTRSIFIRPGTNC